ncbi:MAG: pyridoxal phosphate-dependent aminotransferase [Acidobacteriota bacterium]
MIPIARRIAGLELSLIRKVQLAAGPGAINLGLGEPTLPAATEALAAVREALGAGNVRYSLTAGDVVLRRKIAARHPEHGGGADSVLVTAGSQESLALVVLGLLDAGDEMLIPEIAYPAYRTLIGIAGGIAVSYPTPAERGFRPSAAEIAARVTDRTRLVLLSSPANPTGACLPAEDVTALESLARDRSIALVSDEIYAEIYLGDRAPRQPRGAEVIVATGLSKSHALTGMRTGWIVADPKIVAALLPLHQQLVLCAPTTAQVAALAALELGLPYLESVRREYGVRWEAMDRALRRIPGIRHRQPEGAFYVLADARERLGLASLPFALETAASGGVVVVPGDAFGDTAKGFLRISFAGSAGEIEEGVARLGAALDRWMRT